MYAVGGVLGWFQRKRRERGKRKQFKSCVEIMEIKGRMLLVVVTEEGQGWKRHSQIIQYVPEKGNP